MGLLPPPPDRWWVTHKAAAEWLGVSVPTFRQMIEAGDITPVKLGRRRVIRIADLEALHARLKAS